jgi:hypothetical protein
MGFELSSQVVLLADVLGTNLRAGDIGAIEEQRVGEYRVNFMQTTGRRQDVVIVPSRMLRSAARIDRSNGDRPLGATKTSGSVGFFNHVVGVFVRFSFFVVGVIFMGIIMLERNDRDKSLGDFGGPVGCATLAMIDVWFYRRTIREKEGLWPAPPRLAMKMQVWPHVFRLVPFAWYAAHFAFAALAALWIDQTIFSLALSLVLRVLCGVSVMFTVTYTANIYALLALRAIGFGEIVVRGAWKWRICVDAAISLAAAYLPLFQAIK